MSSQHHLDYLEQLEAESIHIFREVAAQFENPALLFSGGKDSITLVHLAVKAFSPGKIPFPLVHIDTGHNFPEALEFRDWLTKEVNARLVVRKVEDTIRQKSLPVTLKQIDYGIWLIAATAVANYIMGYFCKRTGKRNDSLALIASGKHLQSDTLSTVGIIAGLVLLYFTGYWWIDSAVAILVSLFILVIGYRIIRRSIAGIMDEADVKLLTRMVEVLNANRRENWVDLHNLRVIKYGSVLHVDCHLTVPWYLNVLEAHSEIDALAELIRKEFGESLELFVHSDGCFPFSCQICDKVNCTVRQNNFVRKIGWTLANTSLDKKHELV